MFFPESHNGMNYLSCKYGALKSTNIFLFGSQYNPNHTGEVWNHHPKHRPARALLGGLGFLDGYIARMALFSFPNCNFYNVPGAFADPAPNLLPDAENMSGGFHPNQASFVWFAVKCRMHFHPSLPKFLTDVERDINVRAVDLRHLANDRIKFILFRIHFMPSFPSRSHVPRRAAWYSIQTSAGGLHVRKISCPLISGAFRHDESYCILRSCWGRCFL